MLVLSAQGHQFGFASPHFLLHRNPGGVETHFPYKNGLRLRVSSWTGEISLHFEGKKASLAPLSRDQLREFLMEFFRLWYREDAESARKAAFDYSDAQRGFVAIAFGSCLLVALPVAVALLADSHQQFRCTRVLQENSAVGTMKTTRIRKRDSRTFLVNMEYTSPTGQVIKGQEEVLTEKDVAPPSEFPFVYSPEQPECWSLAKPVVAAAAGQQPVIPEVNWAKRRYFGWFGLLFGIFFLSVTGLGLSWCMGRWLRPRPYGKEVAALAGLES